MTVNFAKLPELLRRKARPPIDGPAPLLYRDDGEVLGYVLRLESDPSIYARTSTRATHCAGWVHNPTVAAARRAVERAIGTEEGRAVPVRAGN